MPSKPNTTIAIIGNGVSGNLAAAYLRRRLPDLEVVILGAENNKRPIVGESTIEVTAHFLHALGLSRHLEEDHFHKYGLTYYFKHNLLNPDCAKYIVHESPGVIRMPAYQLNRHVFDDHLRNENDRNNVSFIKKNVVKVQIDPDRETHRLILDTATQEHVDARWIIDASGRNRVLAKALSLNKPVPRQRSSFWCRLKNFDRSILDRIRAEKKSHFCFNSYYVTHHFYGKGYWVWMIPLRQRGSEDLISIGLTYRPDLLNDGIRTMDDLNTVMMRDHPILAAFIDSGAVVDTSSYGNYMYEASQYYSESGWFLIGDAAFPSDPANSAGLSTVCHQIPQVAAMVAKAHNKQLTPNYVSALEAHLLAQLSLQDRWSLWYDIMDNPIRMAWTLVAANAAYFHIILPAFVHGSFLDSRYALAFAKHLPRIESGPISIEPFPRLLSHIELTATSAQLSTYIPNMYDKAVNWGIYRAGSGHRKFFAARYFVVLARLRWFLIMAAGWKTISFVETIFCIRDLLRSLFLLAFPGPLFSEDGRANGSSPWPRPGEYLLFDEPSATNNQLTVPDERNTMTNASAPSLIFIELWNTNDKWKELSREEQNKFVMKLVKSLEDLDGPGGIEMIGWGSQLSSVQRQLPYQLFALWRVPTEADLKRVQRALEKAGWYEYVNQVNVAGLLLPSPTALPAFGVKV